MQPLLETITQSLNYGDLPEVWQVPDIHRFSAQKSLYDYQTDALEKAARALYRYYEQEHDYCAAEPADTNDRRKEFFDSLYQRHGNPLANLGVKRYESRVGERNQQVNPIFRILSQYFNPSGDVIPYSKLLNRMCFWMATGSGKTLVMVKLIEYLHGLMERGEIPRHKILILAPSEHLIGQIRRTIDEFNSSGLYMDFVPLRKAGRATQGRVGDSVTIYYHRSDNVSDAQKEALIDYRNYENDGKWYIFLDEAHKGGKENSKRQAYYAIMARAGFLFNFSATFTDPEDIVTTVKKYNLEEFVKHGHGKNIYLNEQEYAAFRDREEEIGGREKQKIVMKSLITLAYVSQRVKKLREDTGFDNLYHVPLMLTLVNSVNTDVENEKNDLWAFFQALRGIASGKIDASLFREAKAELVKEWRRPNLLFGGDIGAIVGMEDAVKKMKITDLREAVFLSRTSGALQLICSRDNKELAFQMKNADAPFALIRIGDTAKWRNQLLVGYEKTDTLKETSFFDGLEQSPITILMGSRSFFESWDSNRPNVINFINIGGKEAKKFVVQSVGRGVRIEPLPGERRRLGYLLDTLQGRQKIKLQACHGDVAPPETLFLFATNRGAVDAVLQGVSDERRAEFELLEGFEKAPPPEIGTTRMPLLVPAYREQEKNSMRAKFSMDKTTMVRFKEWLGRTPDSVLVVRDGISASKISALRAMFEGSNGVNINENKNYAMLSFLQGRLVSHLSGVGKVSDGVRKIGDKDIVHFRHIRVHADHAGNLKEKVNQVKEGALPYEEISKLTQRAEKGKITREEFDRKVQGKDQDTYKALKIKKLIGHYYLPVILGDEEARYIQHIVKVPSEVDFLENLENWVSANKVPWDAWMFSKIDESLDEVHIPYYDAGKNAYRRFLPDFVFWMCRGNEYRIVFVDPKGTAHVDAQHRIDGYSDLFEENGKCREFTHGKATVRVRLLLFNDPQDSPRQYRRFWSNRPADIFCAG